MLADTHEEAAVHWSPNDTFSSHAPSEFAIVLEILKSEGGKGVRKL